MTGQTESGPAESEAATKRRRGKWTAQQRRRIVTDSRMTRASVEEVARGHGVRANLLSAWRRREGKAKVVSKAQFAAVRVRAAPAEGLIEIDLADGCVRVRGVVDAAMLCEVLAAAR